MCRKKNVIDDDTHGGLGFSSNPISCNRTWVCVRMSCACCNVVRITFEFQGGQVLSEPDLL